MEQLSLRQSGRIAGLDGLRAIAIVVIVLYHMFPATVQGGYLGVTLFFVLSGYLLAVMAMRAEEAGGFRFGRFYLKRIRRIFPALLLTVGGTLLAMRLWFPDMLQGLQQEVLSVLLGYQNWRQITVNASYFTRISNASPFTHLWSLAVEMQYYLVWPVLYLVYFAGKRKDKELNSIAVLFALAFLSALEMIVLFHPGDDPSRVYYGTDTRVHALLVGSALGFLDLPRRRPLPEGDGWTLFGICVPLLVAAFPLANDHGALSYYPLIPLSSLLFAGTIVLCSDSRLPFGRWLEWKPMAWLGKRSYEIYLVMYPVMALVQRWKPVNDPALLALIEAALMLAFATVIHALAEPGAWAPRPGWKARSRFTRPALWITVTVVGLSGYFMLQAPGGSADAALLEQQLNENRAAIERTMPAAEPETESESEAEAQTLDIPAVSPDQVTMVGDSVMLGALPALQTAMPGCVVDAMTNRQVWDAVGVLNELDSSGQLGSTVIIALGTNGYFDQSQGQAVIDRLGPDRQSYWVTAYGTNLWWQERSNEPIRAIAAENPNVTLIEWDAYAPGHEDWFYSDGIHLVDQGQQAYAAMIAETIGAAAPTAGEEEAPPAETWVEPAEQPEAPQTEYTEPEG